MDIQLKNFILDNMGLIDKNSKESWEEIYKKLNKFTNIENKHTIGQFTDTMLSVGIDPIITMRKIPTAAFYGSTISDYKIPDFISSIGDHAFIFCQNLQSITIPVKIKRIKDQSFSACTNLETVNFLGKIKSIGHCAFGHCLRLSSITLPDSLADIGNDAFRQTGLEYINIPPNVISIGHRAFISCDKLKEITLPFSLKYLGSLCFRGCNNLEIIKFTGTKLQVEKLNIIESTITGVKDPPLKKIICSDGEILL